MRVRPTEAVIDLGALGHNFRQASTLSGTPVMAIVKANAYGHGAVEVAKALIDAGAKMLGVALVEEGVTLRAAGIKEPIVILGGSYGDRFDLLVEHKLSPVVFSGSHLVGCAMAARHFEATITAHVKLDTGMGRLGLQPAELMMFLVAAKAVPELKLIGLCSHFANADLADKAMCEKQVTLFNEAAKKMTELGFPLEYKHLANSAGTIAYPDARQTMTRPGLMLYGYSPLAVENPLNSKLKLKPVLTWKTGVIQVRTVEPGTPVSYGGRWVAKRKSQIAVIPVGYADGFSRANSTTNESGTTASQVLVRGKRAPVAGTVCMDTTMIDVTDVPGVVIGDEVVLIGKQGDQFIGANEVARRTRTIPYEVLCGLGARVVRTYLESPKVP